MFHPNQTHQNKTNQNQQRHNVMLQSKNAIRRPVPKQSIELIERIPESANQLAQDKEKESKPQNQVFSS